MTEEEWLSAKNPLNLLMYAKRTAPTLRGQAGRRKFRLFAVGCIRRVWPALRQVAQRSAVEVAEQFADGDGTPTDLWNAWTKAGQSFPGTENKSLMNALFCVCNNETWEAVKVWRLTSGAEFNAVRQNSPAGEKQQLADLARDIFGNPFRPVVFDPAWRTSDVVALAEGIYADRAFDRMPILADALQDAGCDNANVLMHCREGSVHARGCWVVDVILGKA